MPEEEISEIDDLSETEDNEIDDPDCQFYNDEDYSEDEPAVVSPSAKSQGMQQSSPTEGTWTSKDGNKKWSTSPHQSQGRLSSSSVIKMTPGHTKCAVTRVQIYGDMKSSNQHLSSSYPHQ